jgi:hypothetical protein
MQKPNVNANVANDVRKKMVVENLMRTPMNISLQAVEISKKIVYVGLRELVKQLAVSGKRVLEFELHMITRKRAIPAVLASHPNGNDEVIDVR